MSYGKRRLSVLLCILMVLTTVFVGKPETQLLAADVETEAVAESNSYGLSGGGIAVIHNFGAIYNTEQGLSVQKGAKDLYMGDYLSTSVSSGKSKRMLSYLKGVTYKSDKTSVVKIDKTTGKMEAKKTGTATITVTYSGESLSFKIKVVKSTSKYKPEGWNVNNANKARKAYGKGITEKNRYKLLSLYKEVYSKQGSEMWNGIGFIKSGDKWACGVYSPVQARAYAIYTELNSYGYARSPISTPNSKSFQIQKLSGKGKTITATLKKNVTKEDIFGVQWGNCQSWGSISKGEVKDANTAKFTMYIMDKKADKYYEAIATVKKGSNKMTIKLKDTSLKKGRTYKIPMYWAEKSKVTTFKAK